MFIYLLVISYKSKKKRNCVVCGTSPANVPVRNGDVDWKRSQPYFVQTFLFVDWASNWRNAKWIQACLNLLSRAFLLHLRPR